MAALSHTHCDFATGNDYKGPTFTDGSFANATLTLTKAGAFAASKVNHWLYLDDNGSGRVTAGYYRITTVVDANSVVLHADIRSGVNDPTDVVCIQHDGTISLPWRSVQGAVDLIARDATNGDQVNIKAGTPQVLSATLTLATYGTPTETAPLVLRGYTSAANDGGRAQLVPGGAFSLVGVAVPSTLHTSYTFYIDLQLTSVSEQVSMSVSNPNVFINCVFDGAGYGLATIRGGFCFHCLFVHEGSRLNSASAAIMNGAVVNCLFIEPSLNAWNTQAAAIRMYYQIENGAIVQGNVIILNDTSDIHGISIQGGSHGLATNNVIYNRAAGTGAGIYADENSGLVVVNIYNNLICGFSGAGGTGIKMGDANFMLGMLGSNAFYNCATNESLIESEMYRVPGDQTLLADPLVDAAGGDYTLTAAAKTALRAMGWPTTYLDSTLSPLVSIGALQYGAAETGGGFPKIASVLGRTRM